MEYPIGKHRPITVSMVKNMAIMVKNMAIREQLTESKYGLDVSYILTYVKDEKVDLTYWFDADVAQKITDSEFNGNKYSDLIWTLLITHKGGNVTKCTLWCLPLGNKEINIDVESLGIKIHNAIEEKVESSKNKGEGTYEITIKTGGMFENIYEYMDFKDGIDAEDYAERLAYAFYNNNPALSREQIAAGKGLDVNSVEVNNIFWDYADKIISHSVRKM